MRYRFLGTGASEGVPALFCDCPLCREVRRRGPGPDWRTRAGSLIDEDILIDLSPDLTAQVWRSSVSLRKLRHVLVTHDHCDHFCPDFLEFRRDQYRAESPLEGKLTVYGDLQVAAHLAVADAHNGGKVHQTVAVHVLKPFDCVQLDEKTRVWALPAQHDPKIGCYLYLIQRGERSVLYGHDTGSLPEETLAAIARTGLTLDLVTLDCTNGLADRPGSHMGLPQDVIAREKLRQQGSIDAHTRVILTHLCHQNGSVCHDEMVRAAAPLGFEVAYDGMTVDL